MTYSNTLQAVVLALGIGLAGHTAAQDDSFTQFRSLKPELSLEAAQAALEACRAAGFQVAVSVTDRLGILQVTIRDQFAGAHTPDTSFRKAWTAASFRTGTLELSKLTEARRGMCNPKRYRRPAAWRWHYGAGRQRRHGRRHRRVGRAFRLGRRSVRRSRRRGDRGSHRLLKVHRNNLRSAPRRTVRFVPDTSA